MPDDFGNVYGVDWQNSHLQVSAPDGEFITSWGNFGYGPGVCAGVWGVAFGPNGRVMVADDNRIQVFTSLALATQ